ncbi:unnamed protein product [Gulo gulo]|uniref:Uncharacterized protein n=1 Tax=Gulo gulo TaxID=48420 RepID=A0A9X9MDV9_GULGU|nr:unnamed protein product [Gulo gulo]
MIILVLVGCLEVLQEARGKKLHQGILLYVSAYDLGVLLYSP